MRVSLALVAVALLCALVAGRAAAGTGLIVGVDDDSLKWASTPATIVAAHHALGLTAVRVTLQWQPGLTKLDDDSVTYVARAQAAARLGDRVVLAIYGPAATPPATAADRNDFCSFVVAALASARNVYDVVIWNEVELGVLLAAAAGRRRRVREPARDLLRRASTRRGRT